MSALTAIPQNHLLSIIPNGWEDALRIAWTLEEGRDRYGDTKPKMGNQVFIERGRRTRAGIVAALREWRTVPEIAGAIGISRNATYIHLSRLHREGKVARSVRKGETTRWIDARLVA